MPSARPRITRDELRAELEGRIRKRRRTRRWMVLFTLGPFFYLTCGGPIPIPHVWVESGAAAARPDDELVADDRIEDKHPVFEPGRIRATPRWRVNESDAVFKLEVPKAGMDAGVDVARLHASYSIALAGLHGSEHPHLPSVNLIDGKAARIDEGILAAIELASFAGIEGKVPGAIDFVRRLLARVDPRSRAAPFLAAALDLAGVEVGVRDERAKKKWVSDFRADAGSKPISFYTWSEQLGACFRFARFLQSPLGENEQEIAKDLARALRGDAVLLAEYEKLDELAAGLCSARHFPSVLEQADTVCLLPPATSREARLFARIYALGFPADADPMRELIRGISAGTIDLAPGVQAGWYDFQVHALETFLVPQKGPEGDKLLMTKAYKKRLVEAFKAMLTRRLELHVQSLGIKTNESSGAGFCVRPGLRVEPAPTFYLRTARAYSFLARLLAERLPAEVLGSLRALRRDGRRPLALAAEIASARDLFLGLHLVSCDDLGLRPELEPEESRDEARCRAAAERWLSELDTDPDLVQDTRSSVPVLRDVQRDATCLWVNLGVKRVPLEVSYAVGPRFTEGERVPAGMLEPARYWLLVQEFAQVQVRGNRAFTREELAGICDREQTREGILAALTR